MHAASSGHAEYQHSDQQIQVHGPAERGTSGDISCTPITRTWSMVSCQVEETSHPSLNERKQKVSCRDKIVLPF
jgi:hypothetical protein